jgi:hypothetical protein
MRSREFRLSAIAFFVVLTIGAAQGQSELQKFEAGAPSDLKSEFSQYQSCALGVADNNRHAGATFAYSEMEIAQACKKFLPIKPPNSSKTTPVERAQLIREFARLALEERRYLYAGQYPPGFKLDPRVERTLACTRTQGVMDEIHKCFVDQAAPCPVEQGATRNHRHRCLSGVPGSPIAA